ncbi:DUF3606 domain-containing protein [Tahibacter amnicola]|uniref:DUF3606 domain-containing protein n=1 Tax=Tahibacter amnicola TaxID=2976241 RepID=A0ABY6BK26_9GAMM|nr:DUF3606 domain-containing protein [Tahibacter amnicola]UXI70368.1 DUF3606 domain-containing protein [Tahibacter amnicola]
MHSTSQPTFANNSSDSINILVNWEVNYWSTRWGVTPEQLLRAVSEVGTNVRVVQAHLADQGRAQTMQ